MNFTLEGLSDDEVCIGDRYQIGTAVFEASQPGSPATASGFA
jgi:MOSC domain-containing protein YiiM